MSERVRKHLFYTVMIVNYIMVAAYEFLTPNMSDDIIYGDRVAEAGSFFGLFVQEYDHYVTHTGRTISHILLRIFLYMGNKAVFNVLAAGVFVVISLLIYANISCKKEYDLRLYVGILILMWLFDPCISNSVFWETGACNYMFTGAIMLGFMTLFRKAFEEDSQKGIGFAVLMFLLGLLAGWCNENTSGGVILFVIILIFVKWLSEKSFRSVRPWLITALIGSVLGFLIMILSPGNFNRAEETEEEHTGILALAARFLKITLNIKNSYLILVFAFVVLAIAIAYKSGAFEEFRKKTCWMMLYGFLFLATCYALIAVPDSQLRTYYGAGLFLTIAVAEGFGIVTSLCREETLVQIAATSLVTLYGIFFVLTYIEEGANLARIKREFDERDAYLAAMAQTEHKVIEAPMLRPDWETRFSMAYESDITEDKFNWLNLSYSEHYDFYYVIGVDRETWTEY
jgi:MFS family permease